MRNFKVRYECLLLDGSEILVVGEVGRWEQAVVLVTVQTWGNGDVADLVVLVLLRGSQ